MAEGTQKLTIEAEAKGFEQTAKKIESVSDETQKLTDATQRQAKDTEAATDAQKKHTASEGDFLGLLREIHPALGIFAESLLRGIKITSDLASEQINLNTILGQASDAIKTNKKALDLLAATGAVVAGITAVVNAIRSVAEEARSATAAIYAMAQAQNEVLAARAATASEVERLGAGRAEGPPSAEESRVITEAIDAFARTAVGQGVGEEARRGAVLLGGAAASRETRERLAVLLDRFGDQVDVKELLRQAPGTRQERVDRIIARHLERLDAIRATEEQQVRNVARAALAETRAAGGTSYYTRRFIEGLPGRGFEGLDSEKLADIVVGLGGIRPRDITQAEHTMILRRFLSAIPFVEAGTDAAGGLDLTSRLYGELQKASVALEGAGVEGARPHEVRAAENAFRALERAAKRLNDAADRMAEQPTVVNQYHHAKFVGPDATSQRNRTRNGESILLRRHGG